jgi:glycosyltransferase involved in cell wall biosynthesis
LYVGGLDWRKNIDIIPAAVILLPEILRRSVKFMMVGEILPWQELELRRRWKSRGLPAENLIVQGAVDDRTLVDLYKGAIALVQPSFMEGFGLTALEAMACGTPAIAANTGALPEIVGNSEFLFDPTVPQELADRIEKVASERFDPRQLRNLAQEKISSFTWRNVSDRLAAGLRQIETAKPQPRADLIEALELDKDELSDTAILMALAEPEYHAPRLLVDASSTLIADHKTGIQRVVRRICENMFPANADNPERRIAFCEDFTGWYFAKEWTGQPPSKQESNRLQPKAGDTVLMLDSSWAFHTIHPLYLHPSRLKGSEVISCLYDTVPLFSSAFCHPGMPPVFAEWFQTALTYSTGFVCISRAVADELLALLEAIRFPRPIKVGFWQLGADFAVTQAAATAKRPGKAGRRPSFLMVGTLEPRKGHRVALEAFETLWAAGVEAELIIVGRVGWGTAYLIERMRASPEFGQRLIWHERVDDEGLAALYACADALVAASFAEGFGLPIVEAGHFGKPVLASDIPVFREVGQGAAGAAFFKVGDPASLAMLVRNFLKNGSASKKRAPDWPTWAQSAAQLEEVVCGQNWYKVYEPQCHRPFVPLTDLGHTRMRAALEDEQRNHRLELVEGPYRTDDDTAWKIVVSVTNLSMICWSSLGPTDGQMGVVLGYHAVDAAGERFQYDNARAHIPFVLVPGDTHYMALNIPASLKERGAAFVDIELYQEGVSWFGNPLRVPL